MHSLFQRKTIILAGNDHWIDCQLEHLLAQLPQLPQIHIAYCGEQQLPAKFSTFSVANYNFKQSKNLLGQEFEIAILDYRHSSSNRIIFHLESLAILSATIKAGGRLLLLLPSWQSLAKYPDQDSLRWNNNGTDLIPSQFYQWFQTSIKDFLATSTIQVYQQPDQVPTITLPTITWDFSVQALKQQQQLLEYILLAQQDLYLLTAPRGRGKSALAGLLATRLQQQNIPVYLTAPNRNAVNTLLKHCTNSPPIFIAPDQLLHQLQQEKQDVSSAWLIIDEAAMLPLELLITFSQYFQHILFTTTVEGYEGTGKGFSLKLSERLSRSYQWLQLSQPLRWQENDPLEQWIDQLLLLQLTEVATTPINLTPHQFHFGNVPQSKFVEDVDYFKQLYTLLTTAHYRTSALDLRRLFDAKEQCFYQLSQQTQLLGIIWGLNEGGLDPNLTEQIRTGYRQPTGNLLAQALCFQANLPLACRLKSIRISRIAIKAELQQQGLGSLLLQTFLKQSKQDTQLDFISVSFGYTPQLAHFWLKNNFQIVHITHRQEASSGCYSAMALYPLSQAGNNLCKQANDQFKRNLLLSQHSLRQSIQQLLNWQNTPLDWQLTADDWQTLSDFVLHHRTFTASYPALQRWLKQIHNPALSTQITLFSQQKQYKKTALIALKQAIKAVLFKE